MQSSKRIVIVAGEESGDQHAASLVKALLAWDASVEISGIGGSHMQQAGVHLLSDLARFGVTGLYEVIRHLRTIKKAFHAIKNHLHNIKPDLLILIDYPGFNLRLAKFAKQRLGIRIIYYISPQIWAWKAKRINTIRNYIDKMAVIFPFEKAIYQREQVPVYFVGNPLVEKIGYFPSLDHLRNNLNLPCNKRLIAILPGSRIHEIEKHLPILANTAKQLAKKYLDIHFVLPVAKSIDMTLVQTYFNKSELEISFIYEHALETMACSDCVIVASGTASLECALLEKPMCIIYKGSWISYIAAMKFIKINYLGLCNILKNKMIVPELLQYDFNEKELTKVVGELLHNQSLIQNMKKHLKEIKEMLSSERIDCSLADLIKQDLKQNYF